MIKATMRQNPFEDSEVAGTYDGWFDTPMGNVVDRLEKALIYHLAQPQEGELALDVGTGTGHFACDLANRGLRVIGYDSSQAMLEVARRKNDRVAWQRGDAERLPFANSTLDLVLCVTTLEFVRDPNAALAEMFRVVAPGGRLVAAVLNAESPWAKARMRESHRQVTPFSYAHFYSPAEFVAALSAYGRLRWNSSVFFAPSGRGIRFAGLLERFGQMLRPGRGALLAGRVDK